MEYLLIFFWKLFSSCFSENHLKIRLYSIIPAKISVHEKHVNSLLTHILILLTHFSTLFFSQNTLFFATFSSSEQRIFRSDVFNLKLFSANFLVFRLFLLIFKRNHQNWVIFSVSNMTVTGETRVARRNGPGTKRAVSFVNFQIFSTSFSFRTGITGLRWRSRRWTALSTSNSTSSRRSRRIQTIARRFWHRRWVIIDF